ncbi:TetR/AcrR family transcriptional regulator [Streptomyces sp. cmx-4-9]|uniref:TetR/AcrR family transcriptional regulator n=1 Tax=Streptomyces sp. cmx-4-9 TaxID=2790941 RepID=UPI0039809C47
MDASRTPAPAASAGRDRTLKAAARQLLAEAGAAGLSLEAVAARAGWSADEAAAVFPHRDDLLTALVVDAYEQSAAAMEQADRDATGAGAGARLLAVARALRAWSFAHPAEFTLIYGSPVPGYHAPQDTVAPASRTPAVLAGIVRSALEGGELAPPERPFKGPSLLRPEAVELFGGAPEAPYADLVERGIVLWSSLIGLLVFQVFSRTHDSVRDEAAYFDFAVAVAAEGIGLVVAPAGHTRADGSAAAPHAPHGRDSRP